MEDISSIYWAEFDYQKRLSADADIPFLLLRLRRCGWIARPGLINAVARRLLGRAAAALYRHNELSGTGRRLGLELTLVRWKHQCNCAKMVD
jgi:hypothetical protein